jgi:hypothetical protein
MENNIQSFKDRAIDFTKPVKVFRNLNRKGKVYSIQQRGLTVAHTTSVALQNAVFVVNAKGREYVRANKRKVVHAFVVGMIGNESVSDDCVQVTYNPYVNDSFVVVKHDGMEPLRGARKVFINELGVRASQISY